MNIVKKNYLLLETILENMMKRKIAILAMLYTTSAVVHILK